MPQNAIIKDKTKYQSAKAYYDLLAAGTTKLYYFFGNPVSWATYPGGSFNETNPPIPTDTPLIEKQVWDGIIGLYRVTSAVSKLAFRRVNWASGQYYDMYRDDYDGSTVTGVSLVGEYVNTKPLSLSRSNNLVVVDDAGTYRLYRCIDNRSTTTGYPIASTTKPTFTTSGINTLADGYKWKYLGTYSTGDINDYMTTLHSPIPTTLSTATISGGVSAIVMTTRGSGYTSAPTVTVKGNGTGLTLGTPVLSAGGVAYIPVTASGTGYTYVELAISGGGSPTVAATARAIIAPTGGFGANIEKEIEPNFLLFSVLNSYLTEYHSTRGTAPKRYTTGEIAGLVYRTVGLIEDPFNIGTSTISTATNLSNFKEVRYQVSSGTTPVFGDRYYTATSGTSNAVLTVVGERTDTTTTPNKKYLSYLQTTEQRVTSETLNAATSAVSLTKIGGGSIIAFGPYSTFAAAAVSTGSDTITINNHGFNTGDSVVFRVDSGTGMNGTPTITSGSTYFIIYVDANTVRLATTSANAAANIYINITSTGSSSTQSFTYNGTDAVEVADVEPYSGNMIYVEYRNALTRNQSEKQRFVLEF